MKWNKFRLKTLAESEDLVSSMLMDLGIQGIEIEDKIPTKINNDIPLPIPISVIFSPNQTVNIAPVVNINTMNV